MHFQTIFGSNFPDKTFGVVAREPQVVVRAGDGKRKRIFAARACEPTHRVRQLLGAESDVGCVSAGENLHRVRVSLFVRAVMQIHAHFRVVNLAG